MTEAVGASAVMTRIGGRDYPLRSVHNCKTCQSPHRLMIENMLLEARTTAAIVRELEKEADGGKLGHPDKERILHHYKQGHMPLPVAAQVAIIERRAREIGADYDDAVAAIADHHTVNRLVLQRGLEALQRGEIKIDAKTLMNAIKVQHVLDAEADTGADEQAYNVAVAQLNEENKRIMSPEQYEQWQLNVSNNPILKALIEHETKVRVIDHES